MRRLYVSAGKIVFSDKETYEMVGVLKGSGSMRDRLGHFGYVTVRSTSDNPYLKVAEEIRAHEFHYYDTSDNGDTCLLTKPSGKSWTGIQVYKNVLQDLLICIIRQDLR